MPENYGQGYGGYPQQPQGQQMPPQQQPYGYGPGGQPPMGNQYGYPGGGQPPKKGLGVGAIIGIVVGVLALAGILVFFLINANSKGTGTTDDQATTTTTTRKDDKQSSAKDDEKKSGTDTKSDDADSKDKDASTSDDAGSSSVQAPAGASQSGITVDANGLSDDWTLGEVRLDGKGYRLFESTYGDLVANGWMLSEMSKGDVDANGGSIILNVGQWTTFTVVNPKFPDTTLTVGIGNLGNGPINYDQGVLCYFDSSVPYSEGTQMYEFVVSKGLTFGASDADVISAFGMPDESQGGSVYESDGFKTITYSVRSTEKGTLRLVFTLTSRNDGPLQVTGVRIGE